MNMSSLLRSTLLAAALLVSSTMAGAQDVGPALETGRDYYAVLFTTKGKIGLKLEAEKAPITVRSFVNHAEGTADFKDPLTGKYVKRPFYSGIQFHRVIPGFMAQTGDLTGTGSGDPGFTIGPEFKNGLKFDAPGVVGVARTNDPNSGGSQFFITEVPYPSLDENYTVFAKVVEGTTGVDVVKSITGSPRDEQDRPTRPILLERVEIHRFDKGTDIAKVRTELSLAAEATPVAESAAEPAKAEATAKPTEPAK